MNLEHLRLVLRIHRQSEFRRRIRRDCFVSGDREGERLFFAGYSMHGASRKPYFFFVSHFCGDGDLIFSKTKHLIYSQQIA